MRKVPSKLSTIPGQALHGASCGLDTRPSVALDRRRRALEQWRVNVNTVMQKRSMDSNPFRPGFGAVPEVWVGREEVLAKFERERRERLAGQYTRGTVLVGPSGVGKSVLVNRMADESAARGDVVLEAVRVAKRTDPIAQLAGAVEKAKQSLATDTFADALERLLNRLHVVSVKGVQVAVEKEGISNPHLVVRDSIIEIGKHLAIENVRRPKNQRALVIRIDELQNADDTQRSAILAALGDVLEHQVELDAHYGTAASYSSYLPVLVYLTGLPELINRSTGVDTFRRRFDTAPLGLFTDAEVICALLSSEFPENVSFTVPAARYLAEVVGGDPYLFQLVGRHAWDASGDAEVTVDDVAAADRETYADRLRIVESAAADIPASEWAVLDAIYELADGEQTVTGTDVAKRLSKKPAEIATWAQRLERRAAITRQRGSWQVENRLLQRYRTTGDIVN